MARIHAVTRRSGSAEPPAAGRYGHRPGRPAVRPHGGRTEPSAGCGRRPVIDRHEVVEVGGQPVALTRKEFDLLALLAERPEVGLPREQILSAVWESRWAGGQRTLEVHVASIRTKTGPPEPDRDGARGRLPARRPRRADRRRPARGVGRARAAVRRAGRAVRRPAARPRRPARAQLRSRPGPHGLHRPPRRPRPFRRVAPREPAGRRRARRARRAAPLRGRVRDSRCAVVAADGHRAPSTSRPGVPGHGPRQRAIGPGGPRRPGRNRPRSDPALGPRHRWWWPSRWCVDGDVRRRGGQRLRPEPRPGPRAAGVAAPAGGGAGGARRWAAGRPAVARWVLRPVRRARRGRAPDRQPATSGARVPSRRQRPPELRRLASVVQPHGRHGADRRSRRSARSSPTPATSCATRWSPAGRLQGWPCPAVDGAARTTTSGALDDGRHLAETLDRMLELARAEHLAAARRTARRRRARRRAARRRGGWWPSSRSVTVRRTGAAAERRPGMTRTPSWAAGRRPRQRPEVLARPAAR